MTASDTTPTAASAGEPVAWWCEKTDGTGFPMATDPGEWPNMTVHRLYLHAQPQPSQQAGTEDLEAALRGALEWDKARGYRMPYRVRDPIYAALKRLAALNPSEARG